MTTTEKWKLSLEDDPTLTTAALAATYADAQGVEPDQARAAVAAEIAKLEPWRRGELAIADGAPGEHLIAIAEEIDAAIKIEDGEDAYYGKDLIIAQMVARMLRAAAARVN